MDDAEEPLEVDARGLACPLPVIELAKAVEAQPLGTRFVLRSTDVGAKVDIPVWCRMKRQRLVSADTSGDEYVFVVEKAAEI